MVVNPDNPTLKNFLAAASLLVCAVGVMAWILPGQFVVPGPSGYIEVFFILISIYALLIGCIALHRIGIHSRYLLNFALLIGIVACLVHLAVYVALLLPNHVLVWDDALMFMRYVHNLRTHGALAWNLADGAAYGSTEFLYLWLAWFISFFTGLDAPQLTLQLASLFSGCLFI